MLALVLNTTVRDADEACDSVLDWLVSSPRYASIQQAISSDLRSAAVASCFALPGCHADRAARADDGRLVCSPPIRHPWERGVWAKSAGVR